MVDLPSEQQKDRASNRDGVSLHQIQSIIESQMSRQEKNALADYIFDNSLAIESIDKRVLELHQKFENLAKSK
jgi:dephospho-CoA kinase